MTPDAVPRPLPPRPPAQFELHVGCDARYHRSACAMPGTASPREDLPRPVQPWASASPRESHPARVARRRRAGRRLASNACCARLFLRSRLLNQTDSCERRGNSIGGCTTVPSGWGRSEAWFHRLRMFIAWPPSGQHEAAGERAPPQALAAKGRSSPQVGARLRSHSRPPSALDLGIARLE